MARATECALDQLYDPVAGAESLNALLGDRHALIAALGFEPSGVAAASRESNDSLLDNRESTTRLFDTILKALRWLDGFGAPLILFIDDFHRAPREAQNFVAAAERDTLGRMCTFVLAGRGTSEAAGVKMSAVRISLGEFDAGEQIELLTAALCDSAKATAIVDWLREGSGGLPLDVLEAARALEECDALIRSQTGWIVDDRRAAAVDRHGFVERVAARLNGLPDIARRVATALAVWSEAIEPAVLARALAISEDAIAIIVTLLRDTGLLDDDFSALHLRHDRLRVALLRSADVQEAIGLADFMSRALVDLDEDAWSRIGRNVLRLRLMAGLDAVKPGQWRDRFVHAAIVARNGADFFSASAFAEAAFALRAVEAPADQATDRLIVREAAMAAANRHDEERTGERCAILLASARDAAEIAEAYEWSTLAMRLAGNSDAAWKTCIEGLALFGIRVPARFRLLHLALAVVDWKVAQIGYLRKSRADDGAELHLMRLAQTTSVIAWERDPYLSALIAIRLAARARRRNQRSAYWTMADAYISASILDYAGAAKLGEDAMAKIDEVALRRGFALYVVLYFGLIWVRPLASLREGTSKAYELSIAEGDLIAAAYALRMEALTSWRTDASLDKVAATIRSVDVKAERLGDQATRAEITRLEELVRRAIEEPSLSRDIPERFVKGAFTEPPLTVLEYLALANDWAGLANLAQSMRHRRSALNSHPGAVLWRFYENLARLKIGRRPLRADIRFIARAARLNPTDHHAKWLLLRAEDLRRRGSRACLGFYAAAVDASAAGSSRLDAGLCAECAAAASLAFSDAAGALRYRQSAHFIWSEWGARAKVSRWASEQRPVDIAQLTQAQADVAMSQRAERAKSRFLAEAGHELRTPLQGMQSLLDLAADAPERANLRELRDAFGSLKSVVDDLTELGALGADAPLHLKPTDLEALVNSEATLASALASQRGVRLRTDIALPARVSFDTDAGRVRQVVRNLLSNAIKYSGEGEVVLRIDAREGENRRFQVQIAVEDTGPGIGEAHLARLFEPFDRAGREDDAGLGLGLTVARRIAQRFDGMLVAANRPEGGARFVFSFPARLSEHDCAQSDHLPSQHILLVEDVALIRRGLSGLLRREGHVVAEGGSVAEALELWRERPFDMLILDLGLHDGDGLSLLAKIEMESECVVPALVLTAAVDAETDMRVRRAGARLLRKPISSADLRTAIAELLGQSPAVVSSRKSDEDWDALASEARGEIARLGSELTDLVRHGAAHADIRRAAHRLAGLAAQFRAPQIAELADRIEAEASTCRPAQALVAALESALSAQSHA